MHSRSFYPIHINTVRKIDWCVYCLVNEPTCSSLWLLMCSSSKQSVNKSVNKSCVNLFLTRFDVKSIVSIVICWQIGKHNVNFLARIARTFQTGFDYDRVSKLIKNWFNVIYFSVKFKKLGGKKIPKFRYAWKISRGIFSFYLGYFVHRGLK